MLSLRPRVVIIGAGFAGVRAARELANSNAEILLIDQNNYHTFIPLLYQVATAFISPEAIAYPIRRLLRRIPNAHFLMARAKGIDFSAKLVQTDSIGIFYDYLIVATGSQTQFLGVEGAPQYALSLRTLEDAVAIRNHILSCFERAAYVTEESQRRQLLTFVIVGGGPTGVELAGALIELIKQPLARDYPLIDPRQARVILLHSGERLLGKLPEHLGNYTCRQLRRRGVRVHLQTRVSSVTPTAVELEDGNVIATSTVIWTAGVEANIPTDTAKLPTAKKNKIVVESTLQLPKQPHVYVVGDVAFVEQNGKPLIGVAPEALQQGTAVAQNIKRQLQGRSPKPFEYFNKGRAAIIARNAGVAYLFGKMSFTGFFAWLLWLGIHLYYLPGWSNRWTVLASWIRDYFTRERTIRQIFPAQTSILTNSNDLERQQVKFDS
ncbi:NAD(P)/FAD-dependent oxidoreductase [Pleurocapsales cyanobacterium LEGE 06147]|nr:NAD(P)/FAD-dependent oxidoreductase [Pleurocapsales cyanobacterium LEGE 06147]